jgi:sugar (pentulose or hexulose) kinase
MIAVIDIGMTNKKVAIYDDSLRQIEVSYKNFPPVMVEGLPTHDLSGMEDWFMERLADAASRYPIRSIAVTTHGATFVCVDAEGNPCVPCVFYTHEVGDDFHRRFYDRFGDPNNLQEETGTPEFKAMINPAKGIFFAKERFPESFERTRYVLFYPEYWAYRLTGVVSAEGTYTGCHTYLWNWKNGAWSSVAEKLGILGLMPQRMLDPWDSLGTITDSIAKRTGLSKDVIVTAGIHDSNSSLLPHFAKRGKEGFMLNSTGTWCVIMNPVSKYGFEKDELGKVVFFNQSAFRTPVKTAIFLGGQEFEAWTKLAMSVNGRQDFPPFDPALYERFFAAANVFVLPELVAGSGQFPGSKPCVVEDGVVYGYEKIVSRESVPPSFMRYETAFAAINASIAIQTLVALGRAGLDDSITVCTEGGFRRNAAYTALLSSALPRNKCLLTDMTEATALGAAMTAKIALSGLKLEDLAGEFTIEYTEVNKLQFPRFESYRKAWLEIVERMTAKNA